MELNSRKNDKNLSDSFFSKVEIYFLEKREFRPHFTYFVQ